MSRYGLGTFLRHFFIPGGGPEKVLRYNLAPALITPTMLLSALLMASASAAGAPSAIASARSVRASHFISLSSSCSPATSTSSSTTAWAPFCKKKFNVETTSTRFRQLAGAYDGTFSDGGDHARHELSDDVLHARVGPLDGRHGGLEDVGRHAKPTNPYLERDLSATVAAATVAAPDATVAREASYPLGGMDSYYYMDYTEAPVVPLEDLIQPNALARALAHWRAWY